MKKYNPGIFLKKIYFFELLAIVSLGLIILKCPHFHDFLYIFTDFCRYNRVTTMSERFDWRGYDDMSSFLEKNLDVDYNGAEIASGKRKLWNPRGNVTSGPMYLMPDEKKPYYLFNMDIFYPSYGVRLFRKFTRGDDTPEYAERHKEIEAVVFYQKDFDKLKGIKRKVGKVVLQDDRYKIYIGDCSINNGLWRLAKFGLKEDGKYWKFIPKESSDTAEYGMVTSPDGFGSVHYLETPGIVGKSSFSGEYVFSVEEIAINPLLPLEIVCDVKNNYSDVSIKGVVGIYDTGGKLIKKATIGNPFGTRKRGVWVKQSSENLSPKLEKGKGFTYKLERVVVCVHYPAATFFPYGFQPLGILYFDD